MMKKLILTTTAFVAFLLMVMCTAPLAVAATAEVHTTASGVKYVTGGIGQDEVEDMHQMAKQFSLNILFSEGKVGRAVDSVNVVILNHQGKEIFSIDASDPLLYVDLPAGKYKVLATYNGAKQGVAVNVIGKGNQKLILNWKNAVEEDSLNEE
jgi:hypothetical protein